MIPRRLKHAVEVLLETPLVGRSIAGAGESRLLVLMLHRFIDRSGDPDSITSSLRHLLEGLHAARIPVVDLDDGIETVRECRVFGASGRLAVSITVDDGYADFGEIGWPVLKAYDCPTSLFVVPGIIDGRDWFWWDKLEWLSQHNGFQRLASTPLRGSGGQTWRLSSQLPEAKSLLKQIPASEMPDVLDQITQLCEADLPSLPPPSFRTHTWAELLRLSREGVRIGAHSMTHPILSQCDPFRAKAELHDSVRRIASEFENPLLGFCFPNGKVGDFGDRELQLLGEIGVPWAVTTDARLLRQQDLTERHDTIPTIPRVAFGPRLGYLLWLARPTG